MTKFDEARERLKSEQKVWLVTGCAGFIGSNLLEFLLQHHQKVIGLDNFSTGHRHNLLEVEAIVGARKFQNFVFIEGDISDYKTCLDACKGVDIVLHQAALGSVPRSIENPIRSNNSNITGILNLLTAVKDAGIKRFVYASSSSVYGDSTELPKVEERTGKLLSPYAVTKMTAELYGGVFARTYGMETIGLRYFNVYGRRQDPNGAYAAVIPKWVSALLKQEEVTINGDGETSRDFTYIDNVVQMNILAGLSQNKAIFGEVFNVAVGGRNTLNELYALINETLALSIKDYEYQAVKYRDFRMGDIRHSNADISKAQNMLDYSPTHTIDEGMVEVVGWYVKSLLSQGNR
ncbi:MAG: SDR family oxidoreductase [Sulfurovum sp.]|nr:SDR family oxidoreductase [Sulfurovum sp.]